MGQRLGRLLRRLTLAGERSTAPGQLLVLLALTGFAVTRPLLAVLGEEPTWFTFRGAEGPEIVLFAVVVALVPPLVLWGVGLALTTVRRSLGWWFHLTAVAALAGLTVLPLLGSIEAMPTPLAVSLAAIVGVGFGAGYALVHAVALWTRYACVLPVLSVASFALLSPTSDLVRSASAVERDPAASPGDEPPSVLFIMLDELPTQSLMDESGGLDHVRFPNIARLADEGTWYPTYSSSSPLTAVAVPSILSSTPPTADAPIYTNHPDTLFTWLAPTHDMRVVETATALCPPTVCPDIGRDAEQSRSSRVRELLLDGAAVWGQRLTGPASEATFDDFELDLESTFDPTEVLFPSRVRQRPEAVADLIGAIEPVDDPTLWFAHLTLPHQPWVLYPDGTEYVRRGLGDVQPNSTDPWMNAITEQRHLFQLEYTDALVGQILDALREAGEYEETTIVVTADHGISFTSGELARGVSLETTDGLAYAPLIIKAPGGEPVAPAGSNVVSEDLLPTLAELIGVPIPWDVEGHAVGTEGQTGRGPTKVMHEFSAGLERVESGVLEFDQREHAPRYENRWVGAIESGDDPLAGLLDLLDVDQWVGRNVDDVVSGTADARASLQYAGSLRDPGPMPLALAIARLSGDVRRADTVLLALDGVIITAAPLAAASDDGLRADLLLPPGALAEAGNELEVVLVRDGAVLRLGAG